jgi:FKBP-type peptidyl-prolyl cis-trans isomerase (trigger factor)
MEVILNEINKEVILDGQIVTLAYTLTVDGEIVDTSEGGQPIQFIQGTHNIIQGLENEIYGMSVGEKKMWLSNPKMDTEKSIRTTLWMYHESNFLRRFHFSPVWNWN